MIKIVFTGPESTGKTALTEALAQALHLPWAPEFARYYVAHLGRPYERTDLRAIGRGQLAWERWLAQQNPPLLLCDTDWTVLQVWEHYRYGEPTNGGNWHWQKGYGPPQRADFYFLCAPDFPWQPDPLREHPEAREELFIWYERLLVTHGATYETLYGPIEERLARALQRLRQITTF
ncbi:MAG: ATP-binding protein [Saprospiraceae bacterium]|nr:ATP-binding protein [Saprospiraceae bacterium]MDW8229879.1 ATP-binding protein [Saprospiraceae bacterium]